MGKLLSAKQERAITLLAGGYTYQKAAAEVGVSTGTLFRWMKDDAFADAVRQQTQDLKHEVQGVFKSGAIKAAERLVELLDSDIDRVCLDSAKEVLRRTVDRVEEDTVPTSLALQWVEYICAIALHGLETTTGQLYQALGWCESVQEYMVWSESRKAFYHCQIDWISAWLNDEPYEANIEAIRYFRDCWMRESEAERAWLTNISPMPLQLTARIET